ncbi:MAG: ABC transporter ATP-binding protein [Candidatus Abyssobacteria bacterium SURF_17]|jgi:lipoprotein-releasing system ATP-binding protein|uniref:ABC transporter ATP-binding protein n=1 Tax=Candidatus Abyssobacteria bacterium SURF_17 TaxID=2093361 RepID=A0A419F7X5_9BACT|nr:MAG: ABC transporter ATP-binding protein [Candidatus Abyssubacteria bacterium SURF_17]
MSELIRAEGITKTYRSGKNVLEVLKGIDLTIAQGETVAIHGPSGVGKSTLLHILGTLDRPTSGKLSYGDVAITGLSDRMLARLRNKRIGFIFQFYHLLPEFTARENVLLPAMVNGQRLKDAHERAQQLLASVGLTEREAHKPDALSGGEQQRVAIARALINNPDVVFADEPTGNLDEKTSHEVYELMRRLNEEYGTTFVIVTHEPSLARGASRSLQMMDGRIEK